MTDSPFDALRNVNRKDLHRIWLKAREGKMEGLTEEEQRLGKVLLDHSDEYFTQFEFADVMADHQFDPDSEVDPYLHVTLHTVVEKQVASRDPIEALQFYNAMISRKCSRHDALHLLAAILLKFLFPFLQGTGQMRLDAYRELLKKYKSRRPDKIPDLLDKEPDSVEDETIPQHVPIFDGLHDAIGDQSFKTMEQAQAFVDSWMNKQNASPLPDLLGLSPEQMHRLLYQPLGQTADIVTLTTIPNTNEIALAPVVKEVRYFLGRLGELQPLKTTAKGNLPRSFSREFHEQFSETPGFVSPIKSEEDDWQLMALRHILDMSGWIRKRDGKFSLTKKGTKIVEVGFGREEYYHLLEVYLHRFNWASRDLYPSLEIIQHGALFSLYLLHRKAKEYIDAAELSRFFIAAFPTVLMEVEQLPYREPTDFVGRAFRIRFLERFCEYFGLVTIQGKDDYSDDREWQVKVTPLFESAFEWKVGSP